MPLFLIFFVIVPQQQKVRKAILLRKKKRRGEITMTNEMIKRYIEKKCKIVSAGSMGATITGKIVNINENWLEVETRKGMELINADYIQSIKIKKN
jgi:hypothetical protein